MYIHKIFGQPYYWCNMFDHDITAESILLIDEKKELSRQQKVPLLITILQLNLDQYFFGNPKRVMYIQPLFGPKTL